MLIRRLFLLDTNVSKFAMTMLQSAYEGIATAAKAQEAPPSSPDLAMARKKFAATTARKGGAGVDIDLKGRDPKTLDLNALREEIHAITAQVPESPYKPLPGFASPGRVLIPQGAPAEAAPQRESSYKPLPDDWRARLSQLRDNFPRPATVAATLALAGPVRAPKASTTDHLFAPQPDRPRPVRGDDGGRDREREWVTDEDSIAIGNPAASDPEAYAQARAAGIKSLDEAAGAVALIRVIADPRGQLEQFVMPDGMREWHLNGTLIYADDWGRGAGPDYYAEAQARGLSVDLEP